MKDTNFRKFQNELLITWMAQNLADFNLIIWAGKDGENENFFFGKEGHSPEIMFDFWDFMAKKYGDDGEGFIFYKKFLKRNRIKVYEKTNEIIEKKITNNK